jgi:hypothetical protein
VPQADLDDQRTKSHSKLPGWSSKPLAKLRGVVILQFIPQDQSVQLDPTIAYREFTAKRQEEVFKRELMTWLTSVHVENCGRHLGSHEPVFRRPSIESEGVSGELTEIIGAVAGCGGSSGVVPLAPGVDQSRRVDDQASMSAGAVITGW